MNAVDMKEGIILHPTHPGSIQVAMKARYEFLQELANGTNAQIAELVKSDADEHINQVHDALDYRQTLATEKAKILHAYEVYTGATWTDVQRFFGLTQKDES